MSEVRACLKFLLLLKKSLIFEKKQNFFSLNGVAWHNAPSKYASGDHPFYVGCPSFDVWRSGGFPPDARGVGIPSTAKTQTLILFSRLFIQLLDKQMLLDWRLEELRRLMWCLEKKIFYCSLATTTITWMEVIWARIFYTLVCFRTVVLFCALITTLPLAMAQ